MDFYDLEEEEEEQEPLPSVVFPLAQVLKRIQQTMEQLEVPSATPRGLPLLQMDRLELLVRQVELLHQAAVRLYQERRAEQVQFLLRQVVIPVEYSPTDPEDR
ncbi:hypothetical protein [Candidatus Contendibacter odensensis]|uniref:hypothetical protein n=1 Tax=Candidatus Contendibacter odensensis TaxID=1400860 RepID=UPI000552C21E|nr:hypothetical protein [Candidatus Contendobacter odensis]